jgi:hypothetical protein
LRSRTTTSRRSNNIFNHDNPLQNILPPAPQPPPANPLVDNKDDGTGDQPDIRNRPWVMFVLGMMIGLFFGIGSIIFILMAASHRMFLLGLFLGTCGHYAIKYSLGIGLF